MINTSIAYNRLIIEPDRDMFVSDTIRDKDGNLITIAENSVVMAYLIEDVVSSDNQFEIGSANAKFHKITLENIDERWDAYQFEGGSIDSITGLNLGDNQSERLRKGVFYILKAYKEGDTKVLEAYDAMIKFNKPYTESTLTFPADISSIIRNACLDCGVSYDSRTIVNGTYQVTEIDNIDTLTYRDIISFCAQVMGRNARVDKEGVLKFIWYDTASFPNTGTDGGIFDAASPYATGDTVNGGGFSPWNSGDTADGDTFTSSRDYHNIDRIVSGTINERDVTITGVRVVPSGQDQEAVMYGEEGYLVEISGNPLIVSTEQASDIASSIGIQVVGLSMRPMNLGTQSNPAIEAGDIAMVTDRRGNTYRTLITSTTFEFGNTQSVVCTAETESEAQIQGYGATTKILATIRKETEAALSDYEKTAILMMQLISQGMGMYFSEEVQPDGSSIFYLHDKPEKQNSSVIWTLTSNGLMVSSDGGMSWAIDKNGNALVAILTAIGIHANWIISGLIRDKTNNNYWNLDTGEFRLASTVNIDNANTTLADYVTGAAGDAAGSLENSLTQQKIFNILTNNGQTQGIYLQNGKLYINGTYMQMGKVQSSNGQVYFDLDNNILVCSKVTNPSPWSTPSYSDPGDVILEMKSQVANSNAVSYAEFYKKNYESYGIRICPARPSYYRNIMASPQEFRIGYGEGTSPTAWLWSYANFSGRTASIWGLGSNNSGLYGISFSGDSGSSFSGPADFSGKVTMANGLEVSGTKNRLVKTKNYGDRLLNAYETAGPMFGDIGEGLLDENGLCTIAIDDILMETINTNTEYQVFLQKEGKGDIWVLEKHHNSFVVEGTPNLKFAWELKAAQRDYELTRLELSEDEEDVRPRILFFEENLKNEVMNNERELVDLMNDEIKSADYENLIDQYIAEQEMILYETA